jgi:hypothetical protein
VTNIIDSLDDAEYHLCYFTGDQLYHLVRITPNDSLSILDNICDKVVETGGVVNPEGGADDGVASKLVCPKCLAEILTDEEGIYGYRYSKHTQMMWNTKYD